MKAHDFHQSDDFSHDFPKAAWDALDVNKDPRKGRLSKTGPSIWKSVP
jgi:hypothetical protein